MSVEETESGFNLMVGGKQMGSVERGKDAFFPVGGSFVMVVVTSRYHMTCVTTFCNCKKTQLLLHGWPNDMCTAVMTVP